MSGVYASKASGDERLAEIVALLAIGLVRLKGRQSSALIHASGDSPLDLKPCQSGHAEPECMTEVGK